MAVEIGDPDLGIEAHGLDQIEFVPVGRHEFPLEQAFGPFILDHAVDHKPRAEA